MNTNLPKLIKKCRVNAHLTQEEASEKLNIARRTLCCYEDGSLNLPDDIAVAMSNVYKNPAIKYMWLQNTRCAQSILPELGDKTLSENVLDTMYVLDEMQEHSHDLIAIGRDNKVDENEHTLFEKIKRSCFLPLARCVFALSFQTKNPLEATTSNGLSKRHK